MSQLRILGSIIGADLTNLGDQAMTVNVTGRWIPWTFFLTNANQDLTGWTGSNVNLWTGAGGTGSKIAGSGTLWKPDSADDVMPFNCPVPIDPTTTKRGRSFTETTLYARVLGTAPAGSTADLYLMGVELP